MDGLGCAAELVFIPQFGISGPDLVRAGLRSSQLQLWEGRQRGAAWTCAGGAVQSVCKKFNFARLRLVKHADAPLSVSAYRMQFQGLYDHCRMYDGKIGVGRDFIVEIVGQ